MLIIRRSKCINTASGIVFSVSDRPVCTPDVIVQQVGHVPRVLVAVTLDGRFKVMIEVLLNIQACWGDRLCRWRFTTLRKTRLSQPPTSSSPNSRILAYEN